MTGSADTTKRSMTGWCDMAQHEAKYHLEVDYCLITAHPDVV